MKISIGADHRGYRLKNFLIQELSELQWIDVGTDSEERTDYPIYARKACLLLQQHLVERTVLICGSGIGMAIAANRFKHIYAALCWNEESARIARQDDGSNVLVLAAHFTAHEEALVMTQSWLNAQFKEGRYRKRLVMIDHY